MSAKEAEELWLINEYSELPIGYEVSFRTATKEWTSIGTFESLDAAEEAAKKRSIVRNRSLTKVHFGDIVIVMYAKGKLHFKDEMFYIMFLDLEI